MSQRGQYSVIQFCPDPARAEAANVGVLLYVAESRFLEVRTSESLDRVRRFFEIKKSGELETIQREIEAVRHRIAHLEIENEEQLARFVASRGDRVRLSAPRLVRCEDPRLTIDALFKEVVPLAAQKREAKSRRFEVQPAVAQVFERMERAGTLRRVRSVLVPVVETELPVDYSFRNGELNLIRAVSFVRGHESGARLEDLGFAGKLLHQQRDHSEQRRLVVLSAELGPDRDLEERARESLGLFDVNFVSADSAESFARNAERVAH